MTGSTGSQPRIRVKVRGSKWHAAEAEDWVNREAFHRDSERGVEKAGDGSLVRPVGDHPSLDPAHADQEPARAQ
jgi:hypothetical protein